MNYIHLKTARHRESIGKIRCNFVPRRGEMIEYDDFIYTVKDVVYVVSSNGPFLDAEVQVIADGIKRRPASSSQQ